MNHTPKDSNYWENRCKDAEQDLEAARQEIQYLKAKMELRESLE